MPLHHVTYVFAKFGLATFNVKEMHLQEKTVFDLGFKVTQDVAQYPLHHVTYAHVKFEVATSNGLGGDAFTRKYIIMTLTLGAKVAQNVAQYPLHHVTYVHA